VERNKRLISGGSGFIMKGGNTMELPACGKGSPCCASGTCGMNVEESAGFKVPLCTKK